MLSSVSDNQDVSGRFDHSLEERASFATVLVIHSSSFNELLKWTGLFGREAYPDSSSNEARLHGNHQLPGQVLYFFVFVRLLMPSH